MPLVPDANPIDRAQHNRLVCTQEHDAAAAQRQFIDAPHRVGGIDYATAVRGDAWDFSQASDVAGVANATWRVEGGSMIGRFQLNML